MKPIRAAFFIFACSLHANAAFSEPEMSQLDQINKNSADRKEKARKLLNAVTDRTVEHFPERKNSILGLKKSWEETIRKKCRVMTFESRNSEAGIANENACLSDEYTKAANFFDKLNY